MIRVLVFLSSGEIVDGSALDIHRVWTFGEIGETTSPLNSAIVVIWISACPDTHTDGHGGLGEVVASIGSSVWESPHQCAINVPLDLCRGPMYSVVVEVGSGISTSGIVDRSVKGSRVALSKVVGLSVCAISAHKFPINLVEIVRFENDR